ncbi:GDSL lipase/esterase [Parasitella parasitica]|nr:GDSL lipase/esterase [Parasitella parasitica]
MWLARYSIFCYLVCLSVIAQASIVPLGSYLRRTVSKFSTILAFGDSYTANGSLKEFYANNETDFDEEDLHPDTIKTIKRSTNGLMWVEYLSKLINDAALYDFAQSGATANNNLVAHPNSIDMTHQISHCLASSAAMVPQNTSLYVLWTGVNDVRLLFEEESDASVRKNIVDDIVASIGNDVQRLYAEGAKYIMLVGLIPLDLIPMYYDKPSDTKQALNVLVEYYNAALIEALNQFKANNPKAYASFFDTYQLFNTLFSQKELQRNARFDCGGKSNCGDMIWWNDLHLTTSTHAKIAEAMYSSIALLGW